jgi:hypothetical protein
VQAEAAEWQGQPTTSRHTIRMETLAELAATASCAVTVQLVGQGRHTKLHYWQALLLIQRQS